MAGSWGSGHFLGAGFEELPVTSRLDPPDPLQSCPHKAKTALCGSFKTQRSLEKRDGMGTT